MSEPAAITAQLVDVRNVAAHKSVRLELHVPAEQAGLVMAAFGWPTMADPVPVALARLHSPAEPIAKLTAGITDANRHPETAVSPSKERRPFSELPYSQQCALRCNEPNFWRFLEEKLSRHPGDIKSESHAAAVVRDICDVRSRAEIEKGNRAGYHWDALESDYWAWQRGAR